MSTYFFIAPKNQLLQFHTKIWPFGHQKIAFHLAKPILTLFRATLFLPHSSLLIRSLPDMATPHNPVALPLLTFKPDIMKRLLMSLALALPMLQLLATPPIENVLLSTRVDERALVVQLANLQKEKTVLSLESLDSRETFHEQVINDHNGYSARLNLNELPKGRYILRVKQGNGSLRQVLVVDQNSILCSKIAAD